MNLWNKDPNHHHFYKHAALSPRLNRIQRYLITSATYLREYNRVMDRNEKQDQDDQKAQDEIIQGFGDNRIVLSHVLYDGNSAVEPFPFGVLDGTHHSAAGKGIDAFVRKEHSLREEFGFDVLMRHNLAGTFENYLLGILKGTGPSETVLNRWMGYFRNNKEPSEYQKAAHLERFVEGLRSGLQRKLEQAGGVPASNAMLVIPGGIKLDNIPLERHGNLVDYIINDKSFEDMLLKAQGLRGLIVGITSIPDLLDFIR